MLSDKNAIATLEQIVKTAGRVDPPRECRALDHVATVLSEHLRAACVSVAFDGNVFLYACNGYQGKQYALKQAIASVQDGIKKPRMMSSRDRDALDDVKDAFNQYGEVGSGLFRDAREAYNVRSEIKLGMSYQDARKGKRHDDDALNLAAEFAKAMVEKDWKYLTGDKDVHAELVLLSHLHNHLTALDNGKKTVFYFGNNKLNCAKCEWYFGYYAGWSLGKFIPYARGNHELLTDKWQLPRGMDEFHEMLFPGIQAVESYSKHRGVVSQENFFYPSDDEGAFDY